MCTLLLNKKNRKEKSDNYLQLSLSQRYSSRAQTKLRTLHERDSNSKLSFAEHCVTADIKENENAGDLICCGHLISVDSSMVARSGGCFPGTSRVRTQDRRLLPLTSVAVGQRVLTFDDSTGSLRYDDVIAFLHRADTGTGNTTFVRISVAGGAIITLTKDHLIYASSSASAYDIRPRFAGKVARGDYVFCADDDDELAVREVVSVDLVYFDGGVYAPLTSSGNVVVDDVITSCYAEVTSHSLAHVAMAPLRVAYWLVRYLHLGRTETSLDSRQSGTYGIHPYASLLRSVAYYFLPELFGNDL